MKPEKLAVSLEKLISKIDSYNHNFILEEHQDSYDSMKSDVLALLEEMTQLLHEDSETEEESEN